MGKLTDKNILITGGNSGIGLGMADALARAGCAVSIWGRNEEKNKAAAATIVRYSGEVDTRISSTSDGSTLLIRFNSSGSSAPTI